MADPQPTPAGGNPPPRPGDPIPDGGLDPTQVFAAPPTPPKSAAGGSAGAGQGDDSAVPQDSGPPPPPPGPLPADDQLKAKGYDDEDIRILKEVKDYRFGSITNKLSNEHVVVPAHPETTFDQVKFLTQLCN
jgi:hypothetical protein